MGGAHHCPGPPVSEMTYTVSSGTLNSTIPYHTLRNYIRTKWQATIPSQTVNSTRYLPDFTIFRPFTNHILEQIIQNGLLIGHTHSYQLDKEQSPKCNHRRYPLTVEHVLTSCSVYKILERENIYTHSSLTL